MWNNTKAGFIQDLNKYFDIVIDVLSEREKNV